MLADTLREIRGILLTDDDGATEALELLPPATPAQLSLLESELPGELPPEIRSALEVTSGFANGPLDMLSLVGLDGFEAREIFPHGYPIAHDGFGNYWVVDVAPDGAWGRVYFACHDPAVIAFQARSADEFIRQVVELGRPGQRSAVDVVHEEVSSNIWRSHPGARPQRDAAADPDETIRALAESVPAEAFVYDLRAAAIGDGFAWGRFGPQSVIARSGFEPVWAVWPPPRRPGIFARLFRR